MTLKPRAGFPNLPGAPDGLYTPVPAYYALHPPSLPHINDKQQALSCMCTAAACHQGGRNSVINDHTLDKEALEKYLSGGFKLDSIVTQVRHARAQLTISSDGFRCQQPWVHTVRLQQK